MSRLKSRVVGRGVLGILAALHVACARGEPAGAAREVPSGHPEPSAVPTVAAPIPSASGSTPMRSPSQAAPTAVRVAPGSAPEAPESSGTDFLEEARLLSQVVACAPGEALPDNIDRAAVARHCAAQRAAYERYRARWSSVATPFFAALRPAELPPRVVYPFGGADLVTALTVYPDARVFTALSLETPGDVRLVKSILRVRVQGALRRIGENVRKLLGFSYSSTLNLDAGTRSALPGELAMHLVGLEVLGYEPVSLRYFRVSPTGEILYLDRSDLDRGGPVAPGGPSPFDDVEIQFKRRGEEGPVKTFRHLRQDLSNHGLGLAPGVKAYLGAQGPAAAMTKAASHLLWSDDFSAVRDYLLQHAVWMVSDSTGIPPRFAEAAGFTQEPYGVFDGPARYGPVQALDSRAFRRLFAESPRRPLPFRFGYGDVARRAHLIVTRRPAAAPAAG